MADMKWSEAELKTILLAETVATKSLDGAKVALYTAGPLPTGAQVLADYTQPTFPGYATSSAVVWGPATVDAEGRAIVRSDLKNFQPTGTPSPAEVVQGALLVNGAGTTLLAVLPFDEPFAFGDDDDLLPVIFPLVLVQPTGGSPIVET